MHNHEPPVARIQEPRDGRFHRWPAVWSAALAQPRAGSAYIHRGSRDVLAVRSRAQHSSAGAGPSSSWRSCLVGVSSRLASLDACRARLLRLRAEVRNSRLADLSSNAGNWSTIYTRFTQRPPYAAIPFSHTPGMRQAHRGHFPPFSRSSSTLCQDRLTTRSLHFGQNVEPASVTMFPS